MKLCAFSIEHNLPQFECGPATHKKRVKSKCEVEMSSTQQYSLNFMNIALNDDNNGECTIGKMYLHHHLQYAKEINWNRGARMRK